MFYKMFYALIASNIIMAFVLVLKFNRLPPQIPIFYSRLWGEDQLAEWWMIFLLPIISNLFFFLNLFLYKRFFFKNEFVKKIVIYLNLFIIISLTLIFIKIVFLVS